MLVVEMIAGSIAILLLMINGYRLVETILEEISML